MEPRDCTQWVCCQLGAREHYAVARALHRRGALAALMTDAWAAPGTPWAMLPGTTGQRLSERYSPDLASATVRGFTAALIASEAAWRVRGLAGWPLVIERNRWFQAQAVSALRELVPSDGVGAVFAHSYAARDIFREAKARGWTTILGQIDPGEAHFTIAREVAARWPDFGPPLEEPGTGYFEEWREECELADRIIVNSEWSRDMLQQAGITAEKIDVVSLPFESEEPSAEFVRTYPATFDVDRPLRVLFVGSVASFKGIPSLFEAFDLLKGLPIQLHVVGPMAATIPERYQHDPRIRWAGAVPRSAVIEHMRDADVLVFPSHSDGFGMAQVEAQGWRLPIIASRSAGRVVDHGINGYLLDDVSAPAIASAIRKVLDPAVLRAQSAAARPAGITLDAFGDALMRSRSAASR